MKEKINDGGQAYPTGQLEYDPKGNILFFQKEGMTLRDYFAGLAMQGFISAAWGENQVVTDCIGIAHEAYNVADAMLNRREVK